MGRKRASGSIWRAFITEQAELAMCDVNALAVPYGKRPSLSKLCLRCVLVIDIIKDRFLFENILHNTWEG